MLLIAYALLLTYFKLIALVNITQYLANSAEDESNLMRNIQFNSNLCKINMHSLFGITFILDLSVFVSLRDFQLITQKFKQTYREQAVQMYLCQR